MMPFYNSGQEIIINEEPLTRVLAPLLPLASGRMLAGFPARNWIASFSEKQDMGTVMLGEGLITHQCFAEVQLTQEALLNDNAVQLRWNKGDSPVEVGYVNPKGAYAQLSGFDSPRTETQDALNYFRINPRLVAGLRRCTDKIIGAARGRVLYPLSADEIMAVGMQFSIHGFNIRVFSEIISGNKNNLYDLEGNLKLSNENQYIKFPVFSLLRNLINARSIL